MYAGPIKSPMTEYIQATRAPDTKASHYIRGSSMHGIFLSY